MGEVTSEPEGGRQRQQPTPARADPALPEAATAANPFLTLQQTQGNQAVQRLVQAGRLPPAFILGQQQTLGNQAVQRLLAAAAPRHPTQTPTLQRFADTDVQTRAYYIWQEKSKQDPSKREQTQTDQEADYFRARQELQAEANALVAALDLLTPASQRHITVPKHQWHLAVADPATYRPSNEKNTSDPHGPSWNQVKAVMTQVLQQGTMGPYKTAAQLKRLTVNGKPVEVTYIKIGPNYRVSDGWVV